MKALRFLTYLAPGIPKAFFELVAERVAGALGMTARLAIDSSTSGPVPSEADPFSSSQVDVGFLCAPTYGWLRDLPRPAAELVPAAPTFDDPRAGGRPVYFSDVVVRRDSAVARLGELQTAVWAYNDPCSLSGYHSLLSKLAVRGASPSLVASGSHAASMRMVAERRADAAAVDSNVLALAKRLDPALARGLRVIDTWGPFPIQPVVIRAGLGGDLKARICRALLDLDREPVVRVGLRRFGCTGFVPVTEQDYAAPLVACGAHQHERCEVRKCQRPPLG